MELAIAALWALLAGMVTLAGWLGHKTTQNWRDSACREAERKERLARFIGNNEIRK